MGEKLPYDRKSKSSILAYSKELEGGTLREKCDGDLPKNIDHRKGYFGNILEKYYFKYEPNSRSKADFHEAGIELKSTPLKKLKNGQLAAKERLVMNMIDYQKLPDENFEKSTFWIKNQLLLLILYIYEKDKDILDYLIKYSDLWEYPKADLKIIRDDWEKIKQKVRDGKAHEISEGDTVYLGACTKGANKESLRDQPFSDKRAKQRAFSLKSSYVTHSILRAFESRAVYLAPGKLKVPVNENIITDEDEFVESPQTFEEFVVEKFAPFIGKTIQQLHKELNLKSNIKAKSYYTDVSREIVRKVLGITSNKIEEFEKANIVLKTIRLTKNGTPKESISFPAFKYKEIIHEEWDTSQLLESLEQRFFFVFFQYDKNDVLSLSDVFFWSMPYQDIEEAKKVWLETIKRIKAGKSDELPKGSESLVCHVRPHGRDRNDTYETPQGKSVVKKSFWLNARYLKEVHLKYEP